MTDTCGITPEKLKALRAPFSSNQISKKPVPTKQQTEALRADYKLGIRCKQCGGWHHKDVQHLDYVGHAALTDRLLDVDPCWNWEPVSFAADGSPALDRNNGMWIRLTICGHTRLGYGHAEGKSGGDAIKEVIGDALRNAAMRFGAALDLWHKGDLHVRDDSTEEPAPKAEKQDKTKDLADAEPEDMFAEVSRNFSKCPTRERLDSGMSYYRDKVFPADLPKLTEIYNAHLARINRAMAQDNDNPFAEAL